MTGCSLSTDEELIADLTNANPEVQKAAILGVVEGELVALVVILLVCGTIGDSCG